QYVAGLSGNIPHGPFFSLAGSPKIVIFTTRVTATQPKIVRVATAVTREESAQRFHTLRSYLGAIIYLRFCSSCHGANGDGGAGPALRGVTERKDPRPVEDIVRAPQSAMMPKLYPKPLGDLEVGQVAEFLREWK